MDKKISIVIPLYNTPTDLLERLLESLKKQSYKDFNVIIVDDGSDTDYSYYFQDTGLNLKYIHIEHSGVSVARNTAINLVETEFVAFSDSDDYFSVTFIEEAMHYLHDYSPDIVYGTMEYVPHKEMKQSNGLVEVYNNEEELYEVKKALLNVFPRHLDYRILGTPCARIYRTELAQKTKFNKKISFYEDQIFNREILEKARRVIIVPDKWYYYIYNDYSAMHKARKQNFYHKTLPYWDEFFSHNCKEDESVKTSLRIQQLDFFYAVVNNDYVGSNKKINIINKELAAIAKHPMIMDAIKNLKTINNQMSFLESVNIMLLKAHLYWAVYIEKVIINRLHLNSDL